MTSIEVEGSLKNSPQLQKPAIPEPQKENSQLLDIQNDLSNSIDASFKEQSKILIADKINTIKNIVDAINKKRNEIEEEVIILESDKEEVNCNIDKIEHVQNTGKLNIISTVLKNDSKINKSDNTKETTVRSGNNLKRKQRNFR